MSSDSEDHRRRAAYALFKHKSSGQRFYVASVHLDDRHGGSSAERKYDRLRVSQMAAVYNKLAGLNSKGYPMIIGGDINSWPRKKVGSHAPHNYLTGKGFKDGVTASRPDRRAVSDDQPLQSRAEAAQQRGRRTPRCRDGQGRQVDQALRERDEGRRLQPPVRPQLVLADFKL